jgi:hypothetical protein
LIAKLIRALLIKVEHKNWQNEMKCLLLQFLNESVTELDWQALDRFLGRKKFSLVFQQALLNCPNLNSAIFNDTTWRVSYFLPRLQSQDLITSIANAWKHLKFLKLDDVTGYNKNKNDDTKVSSLLPAICHELPHLK